MEEARACSPPQHLKDSDSQQPQRSCVSPDPAHLNCHHEAKEWKEVVEADRQEEDASPSTGPQSPEETEDQWDALTLPVYPTARPTAPLCFATVQWDTPDPSPDLPSPMTDSSSADELDSSGGASLDWTESPLLHQQPCVPRERDANLSVRGLSEKPSGPEKRLSLSAHPGGSSFQACDADSVVDRVTTHTQEEEDEAHGHDCEDCLPQSAPTPEPEEELGQLLTADPAAASEAASEAAPSPREAAGPEAGVDSESEGDSILGPEQEETDTALTRRISPESDSSSTTDDEGIEEEEEETTTRASHNGEDDDAWPEDISCPRASNPMELTKQSAQLEQSEESEQSEKEDEPMEELAQETEGRAECLPAEVSEESGQLDDRMTSDHTEQTERTETLDHPPEQQTNETSNQTAHLEGDDDSEQKEQSEQTGCVEETGQLKRLQQTRQSEETMLLEEVELSIQTQHCEQLDQTEPSEDSEQFDQTEPSEDSEQLDQMEPSEDSEQFDQTEPSEDSEQLDQTEPSEDSEQLDQTEPSEDSEQSKQLDQTEPSEDSEQSKQSDQTEPSEDPEQLKQSDQTEPSEDSEQSKQSDQTEPSEDSEQSKQSNQREPSEDSEQFDQTEHSEDSEQFDQTEHSEDPEQSNQTEPSEDPEQSKQSDQMEPSEDSEQSNQTEPSEDPEQSKQSDQTEPSEDPEQSNQTEPSEDPEQSKQSDQTEPSEDPEQSAQTEPSEDSEQSAQTEPSEDPEQSKQLSKDEDQPKHSTQTAQSEQKGGSSPQCRKGGGGRSEGHTLPTASPEPVVAHMNGGRVDRERTCRLAERLYRLDGIQRTDVVKHLDKDNDFSRAVGEEYLKFFDFTDQSLDQALRAFLKVVVLIGETQERERVLQHFSGRFQQCNPHTFSSSGSVLTLTCAVMLLNTDLHGQNVGKAMTVSNFVSNLDGMNEGQNYSKDLLKSFYSSIKNEPLEWAVDEKELKSSMMLEGDAKEDAPQRSKSNPFQDVPHDKEATVFKQGFLKRKAHADIDGKRTPWGKRSWKTFYAVLKGMVLYLQKDEYQMDWQSTEEVVSVHHALAERAVDYTKRPHVFRLQTADWRVFLFQASSSSEMCSWFSRINLSAALHSSPPFPAAVGSQRRFCRPLLPASQSNHTTERQQESHAGMLESFHSDLVQLHQSLPEGRRAKAKELDEHRVREEYLLHEICRYEAYVAMLEAWRPLIDPPDAIAGKEQLVVFDRAVAKDASEETGEEGEGGLKKSHSSPSLDLEMNPPPAVKVRRNISERRTYRKIVIPRRNRDI